MEVKEKKREYNRQYNRLRRKSHPEKGLCYSCNQPHMKDSVFCIYHRDYNRRCTRRTRTNPEVREKHNRQERVRKMKLKIENRCVCCGMPLNDEIRMGLRCLNCYNSAHKTGY